MLDAAGNSRIVIVNEISSIGTPQLLVWLALPYVCLTVFILGHIWRLRSGGFSWTTRSSQMLESRVLRLGAPLFHLGLLAVFGGHVMGLIVPQALTDAVGITSGMYHVVAVTAGTAAGSAMLIGFLLLLYRRLVSPRIRRVTSRIDWTVYLLFGLLLATGMWATVGMNLLGTEYHYRETVSPWFRGILMLNPQPELMSQAPLVFKLHALAGMSLFALWPFSRLVHAWAVPLAYIRRSPILYRSRQASTGRLERRPTV